MEEIWKTIVVVLLSVIRTIGGGGFFFFYQWLDVHRQMQGDPTAQHRSLLPCWGSWELEEDLEHLKWLYKDIRFWCSILTGLWSRLLVLNQLPYRQLWRWYQQCLLQQGFAPPQSRLLRPAAPPLRWWRYSGPWWSQHGPSHLPPISPARRGKWVRAHGATLPEYFCRRVNLRSHTPSRPCHTPHWFTSILGLSFGKSCFSKQVGLNEFPQMSPCRCSTRPLMMFCFAEKKTLPLSLFLKGASFTSVPNI